MARKSATLAFALSILSAVSQVRADSKEYSSHECIPIQETSACAPFGQGYFINGTELGLVYGLSGPIPDAKYWDRLVRDVTSGGEHQAQMWRNWAQCTGYSGEPIQYYRTYTCMTDIFMFSAGCNKDYKPPSTPICEKTCDAYGSAVSELIRDSSVCPTSFGNYGQAVYQEVSDRRSFALTGAESCKHIVQSWSGASGYKQDSCMWGVEEDHKSCGFGGDSKTADMYCKDYPQDGCCQRRGSYKNDHKTAAAAPVENQAVKGAKPAELASQGATGGEPSAAGDENSSFVQRNKVPIIAGSVGAAMIIVGGVAVGVVRARKRGTTDGRRNRIQPGGGAVPFIAPASNMTEAGSHVTPLKAKYKVVYDYTPQLIDELELAKGDMVEVWASYDDGWGKGSNMRTGNKGTFPMACIEMIRE
ncbi:hypothetical protein SpCBS45565_g06155 [Spizellomyces sp. 'palustris']|nr:hypothetical protein SpCBS45565_g06155 [Spizellomyces sp. 'palustris']